MTEEQAIQIAREFAVANSSKPVGKVVMCNHTTAEFLIKVAGPLGKKVGPDAFKDRWTVHFHCEGYGDDNRMTIQVDEKTGKAFFPITM